MKTMKQSGILLGAVALCATPTFAQTKLLGVGDAGWAGFIPEVTSVQNVSVNNSGDWLVEADGGSDTAIDQAVIHNGAILFQENFNTNMPATHSVPGNNWSMGGFVDSMEINDNGEIMVLMTSAINLEGGVDHDLLVWRSAAGVAYVMIEEGVTPSDTMITPVGLEEDAGSVWDSITECWINNNNQMVVFGRTTSNAGADDHFVFIEHDGAGTILSQTLFARHDAQHDVDFGGDGVHLTLTQGFSATKERNSLNDAGQFLYYIDDEHTGGGDTNVDAHLYQYDHAAGTNLQRLNEGDASPADADVTVYDHFSSFEFNLNATGSYIASAFDDGPTATDLFIQITDPTDTTNTIVLVEGTLAPGAPGVAGFNSAGFGHGRVMLADNGDHTYYLDWNDPDTAIDTGYYKNNELLLQEGMPFAGGVVTGTNSGADDSALSNNGRFFAVEVQVDGSGAYYLIDCLASAFIESCNGDGGNQMGCTNCPCTNNAVAGTIGGCLNSAGTSGRLVPSGAASIAGDTLHFNATGLPANAFGVLTSGDNVAPTNMANPCFGLDTGSQAMQFDGLRCAVTNTRRHGGRSADANGEIGITNNGFGPPNGPMIGFAAQSGWAAGQTRAFQLINRDDPLLQCMRGLNTSQAVTVTYAP